MLVRRAGTLPQTPTLPRGSAVVATWNLDKGSTFQPYDSSPLPKGPQVVASGRQKATFGGIFIQLATVRAIRKLPSGHPLLHPKFEHQNGPKAGTVIESSLVVLVDQLFDGLGPQKFARFCLFVQ